MIKRIKIPRALREQVWISTFGKRFNKKCYIKWCKNNIDVFNFQVGHNIPLCKGGPTVLENLKPICGRCNLSMGSIYSIDEWNKLGNSTNQIKYFLRSTVNNCFYPCTANDSISEDTSN